MSLTYTPEQVIERLESLIRSIEAGRDSSQPFADLIPDHMRGMRGGMNLSINALKSEILGIRAEAGAVRKELQPTNNEG